ncbi:ABC transporter permease [Nakamurella flava]|uniref:ABC transporter permease n=1 Tax=Nakamurella flava TaxID=2576308 RepID=A0A4U6QG51_9ACTN|nr:ABC transporter permease [Nakamurella flava]TKV59274.1 ABC transporter permease [Nakamurella flava]
MSAAVSLRPARHRAHARRFAGLPALFRLALRRDRVLIVAGALAVTALVAASAVALAGLYPDVASRRAFAASVDATPAFLALTGPVFDGSTVGGLTAWRSVATAVVILGLLSTVIVVRHTRQDEETGRQDLVLSSAVDRGSPLAVAALAAAVLNGSAAVLIAAVMIARGQAVTGSVLLGSAIGGVGLVFAGSAAVVAQLVVAARTATGLGCALVGLGFVVRAVGDSSPGLSWVSWWSPIGWAQQVQAFAADRWWMIGILLLTAVLAFAVARALDARRDVGAGVVAPSTGRSTAAAGLRGPASLATRLQRGSLLGWTATFVVLGGVYGAATSGVDELISGTPALADTIRRLGGAAQITVAFLTATVTILAIVAAAFGVSTVLRLRGEETAGRAEMLLATATSRSRVMAPALGLAVIGAGVLLTVGSTVAALVAGAVAGSGTTASDVLRPVVRTAAAEIPAAIVVVALAAVLLGWLPRATGAAWGVLAAVGLLGLIGPSLGWPTAVLDVSPFHALGSEAALGGLAFWATTIIAVGLLTAGWWGWNRRDIG